MIWNMIERRILKTFFLKHFARDWRKSSILMIRMKVKWRITKEFSQNYINGACRRFRFLSSQMHLSEGFLRYFHRICSQRFKENFEIVIIFCQNICERGLVLELSMRGIIENACLCAQISKSMGWNLPQISKKSWQSITLGHVKWEHRTLFHESSNWDLSTLNHV